MNNIQNEEYYKLCELQNLMNGFEKVFPILSKNMSIYKITEQKDKCYLAWIAGMNFHKQNFSFLEKFVQDVLFKNMFKSLKLKNISERAVLFVYFSLGLIAAANYNNDGKDFYKDYLPVISKGAAIIDTVKFDGFKDGYRYWEMKTLAQYFETGNSKQDFINERFFQDEKSTEEIGSRIIN